jgi:glycosyltransferase involved in cell wall biosynthesis
MIPLSNNNQASDSNDSYTPTVSVIMNCLNCEKYLRKAIDSVFAQTYDDWEIIFWEDKASKDKSEDIAKSYGYKLRYFRSDVSLPLYGARNFAVQKARGKYIAILDCDDLWLPTKLEEQISMLESNCEIGLVYGDALLFNEKGEKRRHFEIVTPHRGNIFTELLLCNFICTQTAVIRKDAFESMDTLFDGRLIMSGDYDAFLRVSYRWKVDYIDKPLAIVRIHKKSKSQRDGRELMSVESDLIIENLKQIVCGFEEKNPEGARALRRFRDVQLSLMDWERGDRRAARERLSIYIHDGTYYLILSLLMYLPYRYTFNFCRRIYTKDILA